ncbi:hypothetical protein [Streptomyces olivaceiscleroticus]|uniref:Uncharacterized protein n=1 Tax=Streptomyces olivaceiscleroticus TaxID=68245 RepID=A0ABN1BLV4_9ACTN
MPRTSKRALAQDVLNALPDAQQAVTYLAENGQDTLARAVETVTKLAQDAAEATARATQRQENLDQSYSLKVTAEHRQHINTVVEKGAKEITPAVHKRLQMFCKGTWTPDKPVRARRGTAPEKVFVNVRIPDELATEVDRIGKDPARVAERGGYELGLRQVAIAALETEFRMPKTRKKSAKP